ncbi:hypothetical protein [Chryseobacterium sp. M5A1_1a]
MIYTGNNITLPPGRWMVTIIQLIRTNGTLALGDGMFVRGALSDQSLAIGDPGIPSNDLMRPRFMSFMVTGNNGGTEINDVKMGNIYINNTSGQNKTYRYIVGNTVRVGNPDAATTITGFGSTWSENAIYAVSVN